MVTDTLDLFLKVVFNDADLAHNLPNWQVYGNLDFLGPVTMETRCFHKKFEFQRYPPKDFCTARYEHKSSKKSFKLFKTPKEVIPGPILGQDRPEKNSTKCLFEAARFRLLDRHRSTKPTTAPVSYTHLTLPTIYSV